MRRGGHCPSYVHPIAQTLLNVDGTCTCERSQGLVTQLAEPGAFVPQSNSVSAR